MKLVKCSATESRETTGSLLATLDFKELLRARGRHDIAGNFSAVPRAPAAERHNIPVNRGSVGTVEQMPPSAPVERSLPPVPLTRTLTIPLTNDGDQRLHTNLFGTTAFFRVHWNASRQVWTMTGAADNQPLFAGKQMVTGGNLLNNNNVLPGRLEVRKLTNDKYPSEPDLDSWGTDYELVYVAVV